MDRECGNKYNTVQRTKVNNQEDIIARIDFNSKSGFGSIGRVFMAAMRQDKNLKKADAMRKQTQAAVERMQDEVWEQLAHRMGWRS